MTTPDTNCTAEILKQRARLLAQPVTAKDHNLSVPLTTFTLQQQSYAIATPFVFATMAAVPVTRVPMQPSLLLGVMSAYGQIIPVINLAELLQLQRDDTAFQHFLILGSQQAEFALAVTTVEGQITVPKLHLNSDAAGEAATVEGIFYTELSEVPITLLSGQQLLTDNRLFFSL